MDANNDLNKLISYPITDLLKLERREELVPNLFFTKGVTTVATPASGGKTTTFFSLASMKADDKETVDAKLTDAARPRITPINSGSLAMFTNAL